MTLPGVAASLMLLALLQLLALDGASPLPRPQAAGSVPAGRDTQGTAFDEIVVETQLAVRPKAAGASPGQRLGRARAPQPQASPKPVFFRPNITVPGAETQRMTPTATTTRTSISARDAGISYAARVVGIENPLAEAAKKDRATRPQRRAESSGSYSSYSFQSSSSSGRGSHSSGPLGSPPSLTVDTEPRATGIPLGVPLAPSSGGGFASRSWTRRRDGQTVSVDEADRFEFARGANAGAPVFSRLHTLVVKNH